MFAITKKLVLVHRSVGSQLLPPLDSRRSSMALIGPDGSRAASMSQARPIAGGLVDQDLGDMGSSWWQNWGCVCGHLACSALTIRSALAKITLDTCAVCGVLGIDVDARHV